MKKRFISIALCALIAFYGAAVPVSAEQEVIPVPASVSSNTEPEGTDEEDVIWGGSDILTGENVSDNVFPEQEFPGDVISEDEFLEEGSSEGEYLEEILEEEVLEEEVLEEEILEDEILEDDSLEEILLTEYDLPNEINELAEEQNIGPEKTEETDSKTVIESSSGGEVLEEELTDDPEKVGDSFKTSDIPAPTIKGLYNCKNGADLRWGKVQDADGYVIYRTNAGKRVKIAEVGRTKTSYIDKDIKKSWGKVFVYYVCSRKGSKQSPRSKGKILQRVAPMKIDYLANEKPGKVKIKWSLASGSKNKAIGYEIQYADSKEDLSGHTGTFKTKNVGGRNTLSTTISNLKYGKEYYFRIRAYSIYTNSATHAQTKSWSQYSSTLSVQMTARPAPKYRAIVIGERDYSGTEYDSLQQASYDSYAMKETLKNYGYTVVKREDQSALQICDTIRTAFRNANILDTSLFYYNGHASDDGSLYTAAGDSLPLSDLADVLSEIPGKVVILLDCCYAGSGIAKAGTVIDAFAEEDPGLEILSSGDGEVPMVGAGEFLSNKFFVLTACSEDELSFGINNIYMESGQLASYAFFTYAFVNGAGCSFPTGVYSGSIPADTNNDKKLTIKEMYDYTKDRTYQFSLEAGKNDPSIMPQHVRCWPEGSSEIFMKKK